MDKLVPIADMPVTWKHWYIAGVASMEQLIGAALSTIVGVIIPLILYIGQPVLSPFDQGLLGAAGLLGIAVGSMLMGALMDSWGYLFLFRLCPALIMAGSVGVFFSDEVWSIALWLFVAGLGVGGGYSLDSGYISEIMPTKWVSFFVGLAKATCALGFVGGALVGYIALKEDPNAAVWRYLILFIGALALITFLLRLRWYQSPRWLMERGNTQGAQKAAKEFFGPDAEVLPLKRENSGKTMPWIDMFKGESLKKVILSGVTWACEGLGVYGFGVFLPILVMALGLQGDAATGVPKVIGSVKTTIFINIFIGAGFALGLAVLRKVNILKLMGWSFIICSAMLAILLAGYELKWPVWISFASFVVFETFLNAGPHLVTYIVPARIFSVAERGAGTGIATLGGKVGAVLGVFFMPALLHLGGVELVLYVSIAVNLLGALITFIYGRSLKLL
ncbi:MAG: sugar porter family MFS transporter [Desulfovibrio sp.]|nr:sugar porter family MFS transporter [Desulfovibrio sp.]